MNKEKLVVLSILAIFCVGMTMGSAVAGHTYHEGDYTFTLSNTQYKQIKNHKVHYVYVKTSSYKTIKVPKYKTKKVTKYKWKYKTVKTEAFKPYTYKTVKLNSLGKYYKNGWKKHSTGYKSYKNQKKYLGYNYVVLKKKVSYKVNKKVKVGTKNIKVPVEAMVGIGGDGDWYAHYFAGDYSKYGVYKDLGWYYFEG